MRFNFFNYFQLFLLIFIAFLFYLFLTRIKFLDTEISFLHEDLQNLKLELSYLKTINKSYKNLKIPIATKHFKGKRILVTGGAGFVGSHLVDDLLLEGNTVIVLDNLVTGRRSNIEQWMMYPKFEFIHHDIINPIWLEVDQIYHLASPASPPVFMKNPIKTIKTNTVGTINMLGLAKRNKATLLLASSSEVYGDPTEHPQTETYRGNVNIFGPRSCYDEGKRLAESLCYAYLKQDGVAVRIARIFNTFGPKMREDDGRVISNFIQQALLNKSLTIYGSGLQTRSFQYISDLIVGLKKLMNSNVSEPVNIGNPGEWTILELAKLVKSLIPESSSNISFNPASVDDPRRRMPDITKAMKYLIWKPRIKLVYGLKKTIEYFRNEIHL